MSYPMNGSCAAPVRAGALRGLPAKVGVRSFDGVGIVSIISIAITIPGVITPGAIGG